MSSKSINTIAGVDYAGLYPSKLIAKKHSRRLLLLRKKKLKNILKSIG
jgi:hypothetical protein